MSSTIIILLGVLIVIVVGFYVFSMVMRKKTENRILELEERKELLFDLPVQEELDAVKKMHLVGQSQTIFREWNQKWIDLSSDSFADLENHIFEAEQLNDSFHFFRARESADDSEAQIEVMESEVEAIRAGVAELVEQEKRNSTKIQESLDLYETLRDEITDNQEKYGTVIDEINRHLANIETEFSQFVTLNSTGDPIEAAEVLETAEEHTIALRAITEQIPDLLVVVDKELPKQIEELEETVHKLEEEDYVLPASVNLENEMKAIQDDLEEAKALLDSFELEATEARISSINDRINGIYDIFEREYKARRSVEKRVNILRSYIEHTRANNKNLLLEIDHTMQSYLLSDNEKAAVRSYSEHLDILEGEVDSVLEAVKEKQKPYSALGGNVNSIIEALEDIEKNQISISEGLANLREQEKVAQEAADRFDSELRIIKRYVEKRNLPGLPKDYLDLFFATSERLEALFKELGKVRINIDVVNHQLDTSTQDMEALKDATDDLVDHAVLAEQLMQYANRYKASDERIAGAIARSLQLFDRARNYDGAFNEISNALEMVEPGAAERIANVYNNHKEKPDYR